MEYICACVLPYVGDEIQWRVILCPLRLFYCSATLILLLAALVVEHANNQHKVLIS